MSAWCDCCGGDGFLHYHSPTCEGCYGPDAETWDDDDWGEDEPGVDY
jgi:hypothetical protein